MDKKRMKKRDAVKHVETVVDEKVIIR